MAYFGKPTYGEMFCYDNSTDTVIVEQNAWQPIAGILGQGAINGATFKAGETNSITAVVDGGSGEITVTAAGHTFLADEYITITGTTNYNGYYQINSVDGNNFNVTATYVATETGTAIRGDCIMINEVAGEMRLSYGLSATAGNSKVFEFSVMRNTNLCTKCRVQRKFGTAGDYGDCGRSVLVGAEGQVSAGDCFFLMTRNLTDATDLTIKHMNFSVVR